MDNAFVKMVTMIIMKINYAINALIFGIFIKLFLYYLLSSTICSYNANDF